MVTKGDWTGLVASLVTTEDPGTLKPNEQRPQSLAETRSAHRLQITRRQEASRHRSAAGRGPRIDEESRPCPPQPRIDSCVGCRLGKRPIASESPLERSGE